MAGKTEPARRAAADKALRDLFRALENRPTPDRIRWVVDQLAPAADHEDLKASCG